MATTSHFTASLRSTQANAPQLTGTRVAFDGSAKRSRMIGRAAVSNLGRFNNPAFDIGPSSLWLFEPLATQRSELEIGFERMFADGRLEEEDVRFFRDGLQATAHDVLEIAKRQFIARGNADRLRFAARLLGAYSSESAGDLQLFLEQNPDLTVYFVGPVCGPGRFSEEQQIALLAEIVRTADEDTAEQVFGCTDWLSAPVARQVLERLAERGGIVGQEAGERL